MVRHFDHVTVVVTDVERAKAFFGLLGFAHEHSVVISGEKFARYMGIEGIEAEHVTLVLTDAAPRLEVQLLKYHQPNAVADPNIANLSKLGFNHICFSVDDVKEEVRRLTAAGVATRNDIMDFHGRRLVFLCGPDGITVELSERYTGNRRAHEEPAN